MEMFSKSTFSDKNMISVYQLYFWLPCPNQQKSEIEKQLQTSFTTIKHFQDIEKKQTQIATLHDIPVISIVPGSTQFFNINETITSRFFYYPDVLNFIEIKFQIRVFEKIDQLTNPSFNPFGIAIHYKKLLCGNYLQSSELCKFCENSNVNNLLKLWEMKSKVFKSNKIIKTYLKNYKTDWIKEKRINNGLEIIIYGKLNLMIHDELTTQQRRHFREMILLAHMIVKLSKVITSHIEKFDFQGNTLLEFQRLFLLKYLWTNSDFLLKTTGFAFELPTIAKNIFKVIYGYFTKPTHWNPTIIIKPILKMSINQFSNFYFYLDHFPFSFFQAFLHEFNPFFLKEKNMQNLLNEFAGEKDVELHAVLNYLNKKLKELIEKGLIMNTTVLPSIQITAYEIQKEIGGRHKKSIKILDRLVSFGLLNKLDREGGDHLINKHPNVKFAYIFSPQFAYFRILFSVYQEKYLLRE
jgi:hypothetical protein